MAKKKSNIAAKPVFELEDWLQLCERALRAEEKQDCRNMKGQQYYFADFMLQHLDQARLDVTQGKLLNRLKNIYTLYPLASVNERRQYIAESRRHFDSLKPPAVIKAAPVPKPRLPRPMHPADWRDVPVQFVKGVGPKLGDIFGKVGVYTVGDLIHYFPRKHLDYSNCTRIRDLRVGQQVTIWGSITQVSSFQPPGKQGLWLTKIQIRDDSGRLSIQYFQRGGHYLKRQFEMRFPVGAQVIMSGTVKWDRFEKNMTLESPECEVLSDVENIDESIQEASLHLGRIVPIYPLTEGLSIKWVRRAMYQALLAYRDKIQDSLPRNIRQQWQLWDLAKAYQEYHFPSSQTDLDRARHRLVFQELFLTQLGLQYRRQQRTMHQSGTVFQSQGKLAQRFLALLPFGLTGAQSRVVQEILSDLRRPECMSRLVQGDVGSGKTVVAVLALLEAIEAGYQGALMAPTEILAEQHFKKIFDWFLALGLQVELLTGSQGAKARREALARLASGEAVLAVGTHALIQEGVDFHKLGLVVIDEQHRFGVKQRNLLRQKGQNPEVLTMTATPIPRTLAMSLYGDLDVSLIDELPPGRKPIISQLVKGERQREDLWKLMRAELDAGRQAYVVFPLVEESEKLDLKAATVEVEILQQEIFPDFKVGLLHGKMKSADKDAIMRAFVAHELDILVATTVIEVGVDVPNASVMVIEHAERFGLAQLHQLRGRVGRGSDKAYCFLCSDKLSELSRERLNIFTSTQNGFVIAEQDLRLRGPGEFLGTRQSGMPDLVLSNLAEDTEILEQARESAIALCEADPLLNHHEHQGLKQDLFRFFEKHLGSLES